METRWSLGMSFKNMVKLFLVLRITSEDMQQ
jgi:hypothetical protein